MLNKKEYCMDNYGENNGVMIGINNGTVNIKSKKTTISILSHIIRNMSKDINLKKEDKSGLEDLIPFKIEEKIKANMIIKYNHKFEKYKIYYSICDEILNKFDDTLGKNSKERLLNNINDVYCDAIGEFRYSTETEYEIENIDFIKKEKIADRIIDDIMRRLKDRLEDSIFEEDKELGLNIILCYAFIKCKILEKPKCKEM